jgi:tetratricopeptide (TPR) repeat protein
MIQLARCAPLALLLTVATVAAFAADPDRPQASLYAAAHEEFRRLFDAADYQAALPLAQELVRLVEATDPLSDELPTAYNNLGVVQFRTGDTAAAEKSFAQALELLESTQGIASRRLISPLAGLGAAYAAQSQHARAADALQRALAISRRADGLFNLEQLDLLEALSRSYEALGALDGVEREQRYALQVVQKQYGYDDPRTLPTLNRLAAWYERTQRYVQARALWFRSVEIASRESGGRNVATINGLLGIARTHRLQYVQDPESLEGGIIIDPLTGRPDPPMNAAGRAGPVKLDREGEAAARQALEILDTAEDPPKAVLARTLIELGDWYITAHNPGTALAYYQRAWPLIPEMLAPGELNPLLSPRPMHYRAPVGAVRNLAKQDAVTVARKLEFSLSVAATGEVTAAAPLTTDAPEAQSSQVSRALEKSWFSPRFEEGAPVATEGFLFVEYWHEIAPEAPVVEQPAVANDAKH